MLFFFNIKIISDWIDLGHPATWVMDFNGFKTLLFCKLFLFNFMIKLDAFKSSTNSKKNIYLRSWYIK